MKMSQRETITHYFYTACACAREVVGWEESEPDPHIRGAYISAAKKRYYSEIKWRCVDLVARKHDLDMTPTFARNLLLGWFGSSVSKNVLFKHFGLSGRTAGEKSLDICRLEELSNQYKDEMRKRFEASKKELEVEISRQRVKD